MAKTNTAAGEVPLLDVVHVLRQVNVIEWPLETINRPSRRSTTFRRCAMASSIATMRVAATKSYPDGALNWRFMISKSDAISFFSAPRTSALLGPRQRSHLAFKFREPPMNIEDPLLFSSP